MSKATSDEMGPGYDFRGGVRGKYAKRFAAGANVVLLDPDVAAVFHDSEEVNAALRVLISAANRTTTRPRRAKKKSSRRTV